MTLATDNDSGDYIVMTDDDGDILGNFSCKW